MALTHVARWCLPEGKTIRYPTPDSMVRLMLASNMLPTNPTELLELLYTLYERRGIIFSLTSTIKDLSRAHGHTVFVHTESWPKCYHQTHNEIYVSTASPSQSRTKLLKKDHVKPPPKAPQNYELVTENMDVFYTGKLVTCHLTPTEISAFLKVPLRRIGESYSIEKFTPIPFVWNRTICRAMDTDYILVATSATEMLPLSIEDSKICHDEIVCQLPRFQNGFSSNFACIRALLSERTVEYAAPKCNF